MITTLDADADFAFSGDLEPTREVGAFAFGTFGDASDESLGACEDGDGLASLGPIPDTNTDALVEDWGVGGHAWMSVHAQRCVGRVRLAMRFCLVDKVVEQGDTHAVTLKAVSLAEEYLQDHFATFPALPGVFMLEAMVQACRLVADAKDLNENAHEDDVRGVRMPWVLGSVRALKYGTFVRPGDVLRVRVDLAKVKPDGTLDFKAEAELLRPGVADAAGTEPPRAASGRILLRRANPIGHNAIAQ